MRKLKGLFITHTDITHLYGASTSLRTYLENNQDFEATVILPRPLNLLRWKKNIPSHQERFSSKINKFYMFFLPWDLCYEDADKSIRMRISVYVHNILFRLFKWQIERLICNNDYDFIYLNSLVLNDLIDNKHPYFIHIRECFYGEKLGKSMEKIMRSKGILFIDKTTFYALYHNHILHKANYIILNNPFDMRHLKKIEINKEKFFNNLGISYHDELKIFSVIGTVSPWKGIDLIIQSFLDANLSNSILLIVGDSNDKKYISYCKKIASKSSMIHFLGEIQDVGQIYYLSDFILRGDKSFRIGRTIYEGLYSGCSVIIPGTQDDVNQCEELRYFGNRVYTYNPSDVNDFSSVLKNCIASPLPSSKIYMSNIDQFNKCFKEFIVKSLTDLS